MIYRNARISLVVLLIVALVVPPPPALACGWYPDEPIFIMASGPSDIPAFAAGNLGIVLPSYWRIYLVTAYRSLSGVPLTKEEQVAVTRFWDNPEYQHIMDTSEWQPDWRKNWLEARKRILKENAPQDASYFSSYGTYVWDGGQGYYNCLPDAFRTARATLLTRAKEFGESHPSMVEWVEAQDRVFAKCGDKFLAKLAKDSSVPAEATPESPALFHADRAYQIAAAFFYSGDFDNAAKRFAKIADEEHSPWRGVAPYLAGRALLRDATFNSRDTSYETADFEKAETQFHKVLADPSRKEWHEPAQRLINYIELRLHPAHQEQELAAALRVPDSLHFEQNLRDFDYILDHCSLDGSCARQSNALGAAMEKPIALDDMTDWIRTFQREDPEGEPHAVARWRDTRSTPWLAAALTHAHPMQANLDELLTAANKFDASSSAFPLVKFQRARILAESGKNDEARKELDLFLNAHTKGLPVSSLNLFLSLRLMLARSFDEFLQFSVRPPAGVYGGGGDWGPSDSPWLESEHSKNPEFTGGFLGPDARAILQGQMRIRDLIRAASSDTMPSAVRREIAQAAWVRSVILDNSGTLAAVTPILAKLAPQLKENVETVLAISPGPERKFVAAMTVLRFPGLSLEVGALLPERGSLDEVNHYRMNWWPEQNSPERRKGFLSDRDPVQQLYQSGRIGAPNFQSSSDREMVEAEWKQIARTPTAPNYLTEVVLEWAKSHPDDTRVPEALHLAVLSSRYGQNDDDTGHLSMLAFQLLHKRYPKSEWAKKTPYWFN